MIKAVIFDCYGVIISDAQERLVADVATKDPKQAQEMRDLIAAANHGIIGIADSRGRIAEMVGMTLQEYQDKVLAGSSKDRQLMEFIAGLRGTLKTAMLSNAGKGSLQLLFTAEELSDCFDVVVASGDIGYAKPEPQAYEITADKLGVGVDECLFTDDREEYCEAARSLGMKAIWYESFGQFKRDFAEFA